MTSIVATSTSGARDRSLAKRDGVNGISEMNGVIHPASAPIAIRHLVDVTSGTPVVVTVWAPEPDVPPDWRCAFEITGIAETHRDYGHGIDSMQALQSALRGVRSFLDKHLSRLKWSGETGHIGFPKTIPEAFGNAFERRIELLIQREIQRSTRMRRTARRRTHRKSKRR